jgi:hypothetical protein
MLPLTSRLTVWNASGVLRPPFVMPLPLVDVADAAAADGPEHVL